MESGQRLVNVHLDTHVAVWLAAGDKRRLKPVQARLQRSALFMSPVALLEMELLHEIGRLRVPVSDIWEILSEDHGIREASGDLREVGRQARLLGWTRDPFDRLIVAHALVSNALLLSADELVREHCKQARWG
jgi:PIN domain nuclease of toxin-antitoxin system